MIEIDVKSDIEKVFKKFRNVDQATLAKATSRSINRVMTSARAVAIREIRKKYNIDPKYLRDKTGDKDNRYNALKIWKSYPSNLTAKLKAYGKPIPLIAFPIKETDTGVEISVLKGSSHEIKGAFIAIMKSGHKSVFGKGKYAKGQFIHRNKRVRPWPLPDLPITQYMTTSLRAAIVTPSVLNAMKIKVEQDMPKRLEHDITYLLSKQ